MVPSGGRILLVNNLSLEIYKMNISTESCENRAKMRPQDCYMGMKFAI